ncbi:MAG: RNA polymerase sigma factor [Phycisphaerales bacterium]
MSGKASDLRTLLRAFRAGDDTGARRFYALLAPGLTLFARTICRDDALADDCVQGAFLRALRAPFWKVRGVDDPRAWMASLVRSEALTMQRTRRRAAARDAAASNGRLHESRFAPADPALRDAVADLPDDLREIVILKHLCGLTFDQAASVLDENRNTLAARHRRAIERLRAALSPAHDASTREGIRHAPHA